MPILSVKNDRKLGHPTGRNVAPYTCMLQYVVYNDISDVQIIFLGPACIISHVGGKFVQNRLGIVIFRISALCYRFCLAVFFGAVLASSVIDHIISNAHGRARPSCMRAEMLHDDRKQ